MAISTYNCLNLTPPSQNSIPSIPKPNPNPNPVRVIWRDQKEISWKRQMVTGLACVLIGLEMGNVVISQDEVLAAESRTLMVRRWSDKRSCPPWHQNSLENIVPENLPRPSAHRSFEAVGYEDSSAPPSIIKKVVAKSRSKCFSM